MDFWVMPLHQPRKNIDNDSLRFLLFHNRADSFFHPGHCPSDCRLLQACLTVDNASPNCVLWLRYAVCEVCLSSPTAVWTRLQWAKCLIDSDSTQWGLHGALCSPSPAVLPTVALQASLPVTLFPREEAPAFSQNRASLFLLTWPPLHYCYLGAMVVTGISGKPERERAISSLSKC